MYTRNQLEVARPTRVFLLVPNLIGYVRIAFTILSFCVASRRPLLCVLLYTASFILDAVDGIAARALNQCSRFGGILDMFTDRASTVGFLVMLAGVVQPKPYIFTLVLAMLAFVDVASHFCRMYASLLMQKESHKDASNSIFFLLRKYYSDRRLMGALCIGQEFTYLLLYADHFSQHHPFLHTIMWCLLLPCSILCMVKQVVNIQQLIDALYKIACRDAMERARK
ncbi:unnamed protein product [Phytomonas sp. EM1]|nr:unnamed protein product [Phytomonas sp. EM1]|eukprot:CCW65027.1 unnamed protein product [Phytomonas sp. isolate EM1]